MSEMKRERRVYSGEQPISYRSRDGKQGEKEHWISHHAPPWDTLSVPLWTERRGGKSKAVRERWKRGAFAEILAAPPDVVGLRDHASSLLLGRTLAGTLLLEEDDEGLRYDIRLPDTSEGRDVLKLVRRGDLRGSSFSFLPDEESLEWEETNDELIVTVTRATALFDVGPVTFPAYPVEGLSERDREGCLPLARRVELWRNTQEEETEALRTRQARLEMGENSISQNYRTWRL